MSDKAQGWIQFICVVAFIAASVLISGALQSVRQAPSDDVREERVLFVDTREIKSEPYRIEFKTTGIVQARSLIDITPQVTGRIHAIDSEFYAGGDFQADKTLFQIDIRDYELEVERLQAQLASAQTQLDLEKAESEAALREWRSLNGKKEPPPLVAREPQMKEARAALNAAQAQLANATLDLERASFSFPFDGKVVASTLEVGQHVTAGQDYGDVFDRNALEIVTSLDDKQLDWLLNAETVDITILTDFMGKSHRIEGVLKRNVAALDEQTRFANIRFGFKDAAHPLIPGVFTDVLIRGTTIDNVGVVPASALQTNGMIWVLQDDNTLRAIQPDILYADETTIALKNFGQTKTIVTSRVSGATEGMQARRSESQAE